VKTLTTARALSVRVHYPLARGRLVLRSDADWSRDLTPARSDPDCGRFDFRLSIDGAHSFFKPVLIDGEGEHWALGENLIALAGSRSRMEVWPYFSADETCHVCDLLRPPTAAEERGHDVRVYLPPGYGENTLQRFPVVYMQDGHNLFFADEAFGGQTWQVQETLKILQDMALTRQAIVVGIIPRDRNAEYTEPGCAEYGRFLTEDLKPWLDANYRTLDSPRETVVMGSSLGGVVSLYLAWTFPSVFGRAACLSSTFGYADRMLERVRTTTRPPIGVYLDSGWPHDNYEATRSMRSELVRAGFTEGQDLHYLAFPRATHDERSWALRAHVPFQLFLGQRS